MVALSSHPAGSLPVSKAQSLQVSLISIFNCAGRIVTGVCSDAAKRRWGTRRLPFFILGAALLGLSQLVGATVSSLAFLHVCTALVGFSYGSLFSSGPVIVGTWFGIKKFGSHWGWFVTFFSRKPWYSFTQIDIAGSNGRRRSVGNYGILSLAQLSIHTAPRILMQNVKAQHVLG